jgi:predicted transcriptional regulator
MVNTKNSERYLKAFAAIEKYLRDKCNLDRREPFYRLIDVASKKMPEVRQYRDDLKEYGDLRNAIVHERAGGYVIAEPNLLAVESIEEIKDIIQTPPKVYPLFKTSVLNCEINDPIRYAVKVMADKSISQIPIFSNEKFKALLTNNTISRWIGFNAEDEIFSVQDTKIGEVLKSAEDRENFHFIGRTTTIFEVMEYFKNFELRGKRLEAVLITQSGKQSEKIIGIITVADFPTMLRKME